MCFFTKYDVICSHQVGISVQLVISSYIECRIVCGSASYAVSESLVIAKVGKDSIKIAVK